MAGKILLPVFLLAMVSMLVLSGCVAEEPGSGTTGEETGAGEESPGTSEEGNGGTQGTGSGTVSGGEPPGYVDLTPEEALELINNSTDLVVIDVSPHYDEGHLPGAVHYYLGDGSLDAAIPSLDKSKTYLVYCHVDSVAISGAQKLVDAGFRNVYRLQGNYGAWVAAGYPVEE